MSQQSIDLHNRAPRGLLSALGAERTIAMIFASLALMTFLILTGVGHEEKVPAQTNPDSSVNSSSVFSSSEIPGVDIGAAE
ncbi:MAG: hypothetical protein VB858_20005 [Planctomycetaceae bacterium]